MNSHGQQALTPLVAQVQLYRGLWEGMNLAQLIDDLSNHISNKFMVSFNGQHDTFFLIISPSQNGGKSKRRID